MDRLALLTLVKTLWQYCKSMKLRAYSILVFNNMITLVYTVFAGDDFLVIFISSEDAKFRSNAVLFLPHQVFEMLGCLLQESSKIEKSFL